MMKKKKKQKNVLLNDWQRRIVKPIRGRLHSFTNCISTTTRRVTTTSPAVNQRPCPTTTAVAAPPTGGRDSLKVSGWEGGRTEGEYDEDKRRHERTGGWFHL